MLAILDGVPAGLKMDVKFIDDELSRRMTGYGRGKRMGLKRRPKVLSKLHNKELIVSTGMATIEEIKGIEEI
jgi:chorismate synthase